MAELRHWHGVCLTIIMFKRIARLFTINTGGPTPDLTELREFLTWRDKLNA